MSSSAREPARFCAVYAASWKREGLCVARAPTQVSRAGGMSPVTFNRGIRSPRDSLRGQEITSPPAIAAGQRARRAQVTADTTGSGAAGERHSTASQRASRIRPIRPSRKVRTRGRVAARELLVRRQREACGGRHPSPPLLGRRVHFLAAIEESDEQARLTVTAARRRLRKRKEPAAVGSGSTTVAGRRAPS